MFCFPMNVFFWHIGACWKIPGEMQRSEMRGKALSELAGLEVALAVA